MIWCVRVVGISATSVVSVLSMLIPIVFAAMVWGDKPQLIQSAGIALAFISLILIGVKPQRQATAIADSAAESAWKGPLILGGFFLLCGLARVAQEAFKHLSPVTQKPTYLLAAFLVAAIPSMIVLLWRRQKLLPMELMIGAAMGIANGCQTLFTLKTLDYMEGFIFFPVSSAGSIIFTMFVAVVWLEERLGRRAIIGIAIAVAALIMMNLKPT
ncbi:EamA family transporter [Mariniblastus fucicola]|uniref:EamA-like transporter family protein n=1 Tax=Mariniblastus fucicola TaxID=980251 RepID=A0A5B9P1U0_9BACT|nr:EamA family transporter [Mariniblastus fucicola]QEG20214.1 EamA-like transporter family protein [Mariniblastus fucicola]